MLLVQESKELSSFIDDAKEFGMFAFDIEHDPNSNWRHEGFKLLGMSLATKGHLHYITDMEQISSILNNLFQLELDAVAHNGKYDLVCLKRAGLIDHYPKVMVDTMCAMNLVDDNLSQKELGLKPTILRRYGHQMMDFKSAWAFGPDSDEFTVYAKEDAYWELRLWYDLKKELKEQDLYSYFTRIMMPALIVFCDIELAGYGWDVNHAILCFNQFNEAADKLRNRIYGVIGKVDLASPAQISKRLFTDLGYSTKFTTKGKNGNYCTDATVMEAMAHKYPVCQDICLLRTCEKMISSYLTPLTKQSTNNFDKRVRGSFYLTSKTGRTNCSDAALQTIPVAYNMHKDLQHINLRKGFVAENGFKLIVVDFSNIELRLFAKIAKEKTMLEYFRGWECSICNSKGSSEDILHYCPKCGVKEDEGSIKGKCKGFWHGKDLHYNTAHKIKVLSGDRGLAKVANFSLIYGIMARTLHMRDNRLSENKWQEVKEGFMQEYSNVPIYHTLQERAMKTGSIRDLFKRKRRFSKKEVDIHYKHALNVAYNFPTQASATALSLISMTKVRNRFLEKGVWMTDVRMTNMVHDELVFEAREDKAEEYKDIIIETMESSVKLGVPIRADYHIVDRWGEAK